MPSLIPFNALPRELSLSVEAEAAVKGPRIEFEFRVKGDVQSVIWPKQSNGASRKDGLWRTTCFEVFLMKEEGPGYFEINISPKGDWNAYRFDHYRSGGSEMTELEMDAPEIKSSHHSVWVSIKSAAFFGLEESATFQLGLSAVIELEKVPDPITYWALKHAGTAPDFHLSESFVERLYFD